MDEFKVDFSGRRVMGEARIIQTPSRSRSDVMHFTMVFRPGAVVEGTSSVSAPLIHCTCEGWRYMAHCNHIDALTKEDLNWWQSGG
jgi:hypothetical protein